MLYLTREEEIMFALRTLYTQAGYSPYHMNKFEEYDLYARNKDYLPSGQVITFTDPGGRLMAMKPDVTLSIVKNYREIPLQKVWYTENVYRSEHPGESFREILQTGLECMGNIQPDQICEVIRLAIESLECISEKAVLTLSSLDLISTLLDRMDLSDSDRELVLLYISHKSVHELRRLCTGEAGEALLKLLSLHGDPEETFELLEDLSYPQDAVAMLRKIVRDLNDSGLSGYIRFDFSLISDLKYYNGIVFKGFVQGIPGEVISGGQYDRLMQRMGHKARAIGFAVYLDRIGNSDSTGNTDRDWVNIALPKGRLGEKVYQMLAEAGFECPEINEENRKLVFENSEKHVRYFWVKPSDVAVYVERGAADLGICGKDILLEHRPDVYELLDLGIGKCRMAVAARENFTDNRQNVLRVATKFGNIASDYYNSLGREIDIIPLNGSIEIAPILGLSDVIVDIVETGATLRENHLMEFETIVPISARLISNRSAFAFKQDSIRKVQEGLHTIIQGGVDK